MSVNKFGKNRSVDTRYLNVPYKYLTSIDGQHETTNMERKMTLAEYKKMRQELCERWADFGEKMPSDEKVRADYKALSKQARKNDERRWCEHYNLPTSKKYLLEYINRRIV